MGISITTGLKLIQTIIECTQTRCKSVITMPLSKATCKPSTQTLTLSRITLLASVTTLHLLRPTHQILAQTTMNSTGTGTSSAITKMLSVLTQITSTKTA